MRRLSLPTLPAGWLAVLIASLLVACDDTDQPTQWRIALEEVEGSIQYQYAQRFAEEVAERTEGEVEVNIYPYGALGNIEDIYEQLQNNAVHFAFGSGRLGATVPESQLFSLHFVLSDDELVNTRALNSPDFLWSEDLQQAYQERRFQLLSLLPEGWQVWSANQPIRTPADFSGVQIRIMDNRLLRETYRAYGADPTPMEYGELYSGLQQGVVDAAIQPFFAHQEMGFYEVQDYLISARQSQFVASFMASSIFYERLPRDKREMLQEIAADLVEWSHQMQQEVNAERLEQIKQNSNIELIELSDSEREQFKELARPLRARFYSEVGSRGERLLAKLLDEVQEAEQ
ncbi:TRAP transporter substrate-binding protein DctP [Halorhodospira halochloris]|uniref:TRAP transporter substrate-binding protein n=1 Tax=Halorhodospira halochloris TaxID=1052 RepID=UPI001EE87B4C|nr:TRAP transporter substrate-binding protein DctP [Halorhodospira halochloris]MCG5529950.1 TRAP transporter substrate-binding protein DctP [Halorhodospira halochloris]